MNTHILPGKHRADLAAEAVTTDAAAGELGDAAGGAGGVGSAVGGAAGGVAGGVSSAAGGAAGGDPILPPDAAARDAAKRTEAGPDDATLDDHGFGFITRGVSDEERAAIIAVLTKVREEETAQVRRVERREHEPWARSQRVPQPFAELLHEG